MEEDKCSIAETFGDELEAGECCWREALGDYIVG